MEDCGKKSKVSHILGLTDSSIVYASANGLYRLDKFGTLKDSLIGGLGNIQSLGRFDADSFLVHFLINAKSYIKKVSNKLKPGVDVLIGTTIEKMQALQDSGLIVLKAGKLLRYNKAFVLIDSSNTQSAYPGYEVKRFTIVDDTIYCAGVGTNNNWPELHYSIMDKSFSQLYHVISNFRHADPQGIAITGNKVNITAICPAASIRGTWVDLIHTDKKGSITSLADVGVTSATVNAAFYGTYSPVANVSSTVTVKNYGNTTVQSFLVNHSGGGVNWCDASEMTAGVNGLLAPGDSITVSLPAFQTRLYGLPVGATAQFCFYSTVPNASHDLQNQNDWFCAATLVVGVEENVKAQYFKIFPNPGSNEIHIEGEFAINSVEILDATGHQKYSLDNVQQMNCTLRHDLSPGIYLLKIRSSETTILKKIIVE